MAPKSTKSEGKSHWLVGLFLLAFSFFLIISLRSYSPSDPQFIFYSSNEHPKFIFFSTIEKPFMNLGGPIGAFFASSLIIFVGASRYLLIIVLCCLAYQMFQRSRPKYLWAAFPAGLAIPLIISSAGSLIYFWFTEAEAAKHAGGLLGYWIAQFLLKWLSWGAILLLIPVGVVLLKFSSKLLPELILWTFEEGGRWVWKWGWPSLSSLFRKCLPLGMFSSLYKFLKSVVSGFPLLRLFNKIKEIRENREKSMEKPEQGLEGNDEVKSTAAPPVVSAAREANNLTILSDGADISYEIPEKYQRPVPQDPDRDTDQEGREFRVIPREPRDVVQREVSQKRKEILRNGYQLPSLTLLDAPPHMESGASDDELRSNARILENKLKDFGIDGRVVQALPGPVITMYEYEPAPGIKVSRIVSLSDDLALAMKAMTVRIVAPIPGKAVVGIEIPNAKRESVYLKEILSSDEFRKTQARLCLGLGKDILGRPTVTDLGKIPHLLIAGATGSGKSVSVNSIICSLLFNSTPEEVRLVMIDPKMLELSIYDGIPNLLVPVVTHPKKAAAALRGLVEEMERRYQVMADVGVRNIAGYNQWVEEEKAKIKKPSFFAKEEDDDEEPAEEAVLEKIPYIVVIIDELADLMMVSSKDVEESITRLAQMARAAGIHLLVATQRPSVDVLTGLIKANFPARISFQVSSKTDSRTILDANGAEKLLGMGDMLFLPPGTSKLQRIHGAFVSEAEIKRLVTHLKQQQTPLYNESIFKTADDGKEEISEEDLDDKYDEAVALVAKTRQASISMIQRRLRIGYNRSARMIEMMEKEGLIGPADGSKPRDVYIREDYQKKDWVE